MDPDFQMSPADWEKNQHQHDLDKWQEAMSRRASGTTQVNTPSASMIVTSQDTKYLSLMTALSSSIASLSADDASSLLGDCLKMLRVQ